MAADDDIALATAKSRAARQRLTATLVDIQQRLRPGVLLREAVEEVRDTGLDLLKSGLAKARENPGPLIGIGAMVAAYFSRNWFTASAQDDVAAPPPSPTDSDLPVKSKSKAKAKAAKRKSE